MRFLLHHSPPCSFKAGSLLKPGACIFSPMLVASEPLASVPFSAGVKGVHETTPAFTQSFICIKFIVCPTLGQQKLFLHYRCQHLLLLLPSPSPFWFVKSYLEAKRTFTELVEGQATRNIEEASYRFCHIKTVNALLP